MPADLPQTDDFRKLFLEDTPLLDVRAPVEFDEGAFPAAHNLPLVNNDERHLIGKCYQEQGQDAAIALGHELVRGDLKAARITAWTNYLRAQPNAVLYCFRGGMRSKISQQWLQEHAGIGITRVRGGYKALRGFLLEELEQSAAEVRPILLGGRTGVGKTRVLKALSPDLDPHLIDLEGLAWHRGSAFGRHPTPQPTQINFENTLSIALIKHRALTDGPLIVEDESKNVGSRHIPIKLWEAFSRAPVVLLEASLEQRVDITLQEYVTDALEEYRALFGAQEGYQRWSANLLDSLGRIRKRLGGESHQQLDRMLRTALDHQVTSDDVGLHRGWIAALLSEYYDPMYDYQLDKKQQRVCFTGDAPEVIAYLRSQINA